ncbi:hypothetical protein IMSHALPRED_008272 [Imshaugia aleurites]|uniref:BZIP domain-containing protein n=1 Tax=Imshaugia aleurites TaxID=172621 RepID=A0A8H3FX97_9LECA|nr:hypothetical protein IMSHALPRED_008272 [Imshaugia aleurites]
MANTSPHVLTPSASSTTNKPLAPMPGTTYAPAISMHKEWVLPPKPKPGRKPAVDMPPTKRKAQNREAQRAFRERRAAKVSELEDQIKAKEEEDQREQERLVARVEQLEYRLEDYTQKLMYWRGRYREIEDAYGREKELRQRAESETEMLRRGMANGTEAIPLPPRRPLQNGYMAEPVPGAHDGTTATELSPLGCGKCSAETRCQCIDDAFQMDNVATEPDALTFKRPHSPQSHTDNKRRQLSNTETSLEIDFTAQFSSRRPPTLATSASTSSSVAATGMPDPCGFCSDDTTCLCAELAKERPERAVKPPATTLPMLPESATTNPSTSNPCINGPGTCAQCRSNPTSTLFCKSLATTRPLNPSQLSPTTKSTTNQAITQGSTLNCADAFTVLSRHPGFDQATSELNSWIPHLSKVPTATTAFDIEAASVMSVLKLFDRRFGNTGQTRPTSPTETSNDQLDRIPVTASRNGEGGGTLNEAIKTRDGRGGNTVGKQDTKDGTRIA